MLRTPEHSHFPPPLAFTMMSEFPEDLEDPTTLSPFDAALEDSPQPKSPNKKWRFQSAKRWVVGRGNSTTSSADFNLNSRSEDKSDSDHGLEMEVSNSGLLETTHSEELGDSRHDAATTFDRFLGNDDQSPVEVNEDSAILSVVSEELLSLELVEIDPEIGGLEATTTSSFLEQSMNQIQRIQQGIAYMVNPYENNESEGSLEDAHTPLLGTEPPTPTTTSTRESWSVLAVVALVMIAFYILDSLYILFETILA